MVAALRAASASTDRQSGRKGAPTTTECRDILDSLADRFSGLQARMFDDDQLYWSTHPISLPDDVENPTYVYSMMMPRQTGMAEGILGNKLAAVTMAARATRSDEARAKTELFQNHTNRAFPRLEQQAGASVGGPVVQDVLKYGFGVDNLIPDPRRLGKYGKAVKDFDSPDQYSRDRSRFLQRMGERGGRLPAVWIHVPARNAMWIESPESDGISLAVERRDRYLRDVAEDPRYKDSDAVGELTRAYRLAGDTERRRLGAQLCSVWTLQDANWLTQFVTPPDQSFGPTQAGPSDSFQSWAGRYDLGEIAYSVPNFLGRVTYTVTKGLRTSSADPAKSLIGMCHHARSGIKTYDWALTMLACALKDQSFAPWVYMPGSSRVNGEVVRPTPSPPGRRKIRIARGNGFVTELDPDSRLQQLIAEAPPLLLPFIERLASNLSLLLIPDTLLDAMASSSGYEYNSLRNTVISRLNPVIEGFELAMCQRADLLAAIWAHLGEVVTISAIEGDREVKSYAFDPREYKDLDVTMDATFSVPRPEDNMAELQAAAFAVEKNLLDYAAAREKYLHIGNSDEIEAAILTDKYKASPQVAEFILSKAAEQAGISLEQEAAKSNGDVSVQDLLNTNPELLRALAQRAQPGDAGYQAIMEAAKQAGMLPPTPASPDAAAPDGGPVPGGGPVGPVAGQMPSLPGGPRLVGGLGSP